MRSSCSAVERKDAHQTVPFNMRMDVTLRDQLRRYCDETGQSATTAVSRCLDKALKDYFDSDRKVHW